jgi:hypothetical protein
VTLLLPILSVLWKIAKFSIPIPLGIIFALGLAYQFLLPLKIRAAVQARVTEMVTQAEHEALQEKLKASQAREAKTQELLHEAQRRSNILSEANARLQQQAAVDAAYQAEEEKKQGDIAKTPLGDCIARGAVRQRLRNNR